MLYIVVLFISCIFLTFSYSYVDKLLQQHTPRYSSSDKQVYIVKNVVKSIYLFILAVSAPLIIRTWENHMIKIFAALYVSNDLMGMIVCPNLPTSTRIHHMTSVLFLMAAFMVDFTTNHIAQMLFYYTYASALAFTVNAYLGLRLCYERDNHPKWLRNLKHIAKYSYLFICIGNWCHQMYLMEWVYEESIYCFMISLIIIDDILLLRWLFKN
jgi:hypothetical protein